jgi:hypothetical protein
MATKVTLRNEETTIERLKLKAETDLIAALIQYRESTKAAGRHKLSAWANVELVRIAMLASDVSSDLLIEEAISAFHRSGVAHQKITTDMLRKFRSTLRDDELEALLAAYMKPGDIFVQGSYD